MLLHHLPVIVYMIDLMFTLVNVYVDLVVFTRIVGTSKTGSGRYWCLYYIENMPHA